MFVTEELLPSAPSGEEAKIIEGRPHANSPEDCLLGVRVHALQLPKEGDDKAEPPLLCGQGTPSSDSNTLACLQLNRLDLEVQGWVRALPRLLWGIPP